MMLISRFVITTAGILATSAFVGVRGVNNGKSITPQMGWNTWNYHGCNISEQIVLTAAEQLKASGLKDKGYEIVWIDDCWQADRRDPTTGEIPANAEKFPNGLKSLTDQIHQMGFQAGIYSSAGTMTCGGKVGSLDHEETDARSWAEAGFDALKYDNCYNQGRSGTPKISFDRYHAMSAAVNKTGRPMTLSLCNWGEDQPWNFALETWNSWRISGDIYDNFNRDDVRCPCTSMIDCKLSGYHCSVEKIINFAAPLGQKARSGAWNDLDMLEVGNGGMTRDQEVTHFSMWAMVKSPLIMGNDMATLTNQTMAIVGNEEVIALNQDSKYSPANQIWSQAQGKQQLWLASLDNSSYAVALVNFDNQSWTTNSTTATTFRDIFVDEPSMATTKFDAYDLWANVNFDDHTQSKPASKMNGSPFSNALPSLTVPAYGTTLLKLVPNNASSTTNDIVLEPRSVRWQRMGRD